MELNSHRFSILSQLTRDVLAIPISTVVSESAFSTGGRVVDAFRSSLTPKMVQALICAQDWLREPSHLELYDMKKEIEEFDKIDLGNISMHFFLSFYFLSFYNSLFSFSFTNFLCIFRFIKDCIGAYN